ncbi:gamma-butyrobetaine hydroxylase-like domain-containing protein [Brucella endophytica]|uniref:gamma-butyrobetaine hydroxylase-like domain-containing protein n=1 Tax=Brucella endophytica TaxID=1963359 RepID=UPI0035710C91
MEGAVADVWPKELRVSPDRRTLTISFDNGEAYTLPAEMLRVLSPSAEVQGHSPEQRVTVPGKIDVTILRIDPVGNYAIRITFDDRHDTGLFTWTYLRQLGLEKETRWQAYLDELAQKGLSRER